jgi:sterol desaturase/sphingolipid hydroxylase (fatty acid hydroxylase superfamily)
MIGFGIDQFFIVHLFALSVGHFNHANIKVPLGFLKYIFNNPQFHTWHHAKKLPKQQRYGTNFAITLSIWDYLFNTAYQPNDGENTELGYDEEKEMPKTFLGQVIFPWKKSK